MSPEGTAAAGPRGARGGRAPVRKEVRGCPESLPILRRCTTAADGALRVIASGLWCPGRAGRIGSGPAAGIGPAERAQRAGCARVGLKRGRYGPEDTSEGGWAGWGVWGGGGAAGPPGRRGGEDESRQAQRPPQAERARTRPPGRRDIGRAASESTPSRFGRPGPGPAQPADASIRGPRVRLGRCWPGRPHRDSEGGPLRRRRGERTGCAAANRRDYHQCRPLGCVTRSSDAIPPAISLSPLGPATTRTRHPGFVVRSGHTIIGPIELVSGANQILPCRFHGSGWAHGN